MQRLVPLLTFELPCHDCYIKTAILWSWAHPSWPASSSSWPLSTPDFDIPHKSTTLGPQVLWCFFYLNYFWITNPSLPTGSHLGPLAPNPHQPMPVYQQAVCLILSPLDGGSDLYLRYLRFCMAKKMQPKVELPDWQDFNLPTRTTFLKR